MDEQKVRVWDRHQWASGMAPATPVEMESQIEEWDLIEWVGEKPRTTGEAFVAEAELDCRPHGFSGFGVSDSGGQRWASSTVIELERTSTDRDPATLRKVA